MFKRRMIDFILAVGAGISISIGGIAFLAASNNVVGSLFFTVGLFIVLTFGLNLFTGKVCYCLDNKLNYLLCLLTIWIGNFVGCCLVGYSLRLTRLDSLYEKVVKISEIKINDNLLSLFVLAIFCNILIYIAVEGFRKAKDPVEKYLTVILPVSVFVLCGFEHCVADMFYFSYANAWSLKGFLAIFIITLGNVVGGLIFPLGKRIISKLKDKESILNN